MGFELPQSSSDEDVGQKVERTANLEGVACEQFLERVYSSSRAGLLAHVIPSPINHCILIPEFRLQNFASSSPYPDTARTPSRF